jgi:hypothetical protein
LNRFLNKAIAIYKYRYNQAVDERDQVYSNLVQYMGGQEQFLKFRQDYHNKQLAKVLTNENEVQNYSVHDGEMIPLKEAVYRQPSERIWRTHFYSPVKFVFGREIGTYWFNLLVIWLFSGLLFIMLYYDLIRKLLTYFETLRLNRLNRIRLTRLIKITEQYRPVRRKK